LLHDSSAFAQATRATTRPLKPEGARPAPTTMSAPQSVVTHPAAGVPAPPSNLKATDTPNDAGGSLTLTWTLSPDDTSAARRTVANYVVLRAPSATGPFAPLDTVPGQMTTTTDDHARNGRPVYYEIVSLGANGALSAPSNVASAVPSQQWIHTQRVTMLITLLVFAGIFAFSLISARRGRGFIRRIPGLDAVEEAIGRATEMGKPVLYVPGIQDIRDIQTIASMVILGNVAKITAKYDTPLIVPVANAVVMSAAEERVKAAYLEAGRPDSYNPDNIRYLSDEQFAYTAGVTGIMMRERPAANIYMGSFYAESLMLAETGFSTGALQVAGTAQVAQLPFFVVACDYTLIGEELYAASAYLSREPMLLGSLNAADYMKALLVAAIVIGSLLLTFHQPAIQTFFLSG
jgi:hypothetical protein